MLTIVSLSLGVENHLSVNRDGVVRFRRGKMQCSQLIRSIFQFDNADCRANS
ncbi:unknown protein [Microcystis aeruginosa NIES-843]|uniref:Uncharacterized protein n=1 Tax=Microcystis aeruginosa (strain NIES-843 / IAM M-2473) TaxID=449447 RepID=B0JLJ5_MICAN|nr:unknown protein [Microcystis aeruginosa NIES-843]